MRSTPFGSWLGVIAACPELASAMGELAHEAGRDERRSPGYAVWGSSSGWLVFYAALGLGVPSVGYEILKCHVDAARRVGGGERRVGGSSVVRARRRGGGAAQRREGRRVDVAVLGRGAEDTRRAAIGGGSRARCARGGLRARLAQRRRSASPSPPSPRRRRGTPNKNSTCFDDARDGRVRTRAARRHRDGPRDDCELLSS